MASSLPSSRKRPLPVKEISIGCGDTNKLSKPGLLPTIPVFSSSSVTLDSSLLWDQFDTYQALHIPNETVKQLLMNQSKTENGSPKNNNYKVFTWKDIQRLFQSLQEKDKETWCIENYGQSDRTNDKHIRNEQDDNVVASDFLEPQPSSRYVTGYCSFMVQHDKSSMDTTLDGLPLSNLPCRSRIRYGPCLWFFFGRNASPTCLEGRPEHTDSVSHDGTWHYQLSGCKMWYLRPTSELLNNYWKDRLDHDDDSVPWTQAVSCQVNCQEGDVLIVNTRLWWHRTTIPPLQTVPSVSYARDFYLGDKSDNDTAGESSDQVTEASNDAPDTMTNVDGLYAANDIVQGTMIFSEKEMPDCELHRSKTNPNCEIVQLEDGMGAVVSCRDINAGEFFCVPESSSEEEEEGFEEADEEEFEDDEP